ncbi:metal ABC transporter permease [Candidatus Jorgensenbacteria bacterium]|nr:metal ABC transporter permease [Candidatus Jorgensenbacteria bacterium]
MAITPFFTTTTSTTLPKTMPDIFPLILISGIAVAAASGLMGSFLVLRRMTLLSDALSHVALPGIALGIIFGFQPLIGGVLFLFFGALLVWQIEHKTKLATESVTAVLFVTMLAIGTLITPETELLETFFGNVSHITPFQAILQIIIGLAIIFTVAKYFKPLLITSIAPDLAAASKISQEKMHLLLLVLVTLTIAIGISFVGILLMSALSIIPAATARNLSQSYREFVTLSVGLAVATLSGGLLIGYLTSIDSSIAAVLLNALLFTASLFKKR